MTTSVKATSVTPAAIITHTTVSIKGQQDVDISVHHARTPDARISLVFNGIHMIMYSCSAVQGLLEAFAAARGQMMHIPAEIPATKTNLPETDARIALSIEWTRRPKLCGRRPIGSQSAQDRHASLGRPLHRPTDLADPRRGRTVVHDRIARPRPQDGHRDLQRRLSVQRRPDRAQLRRGLEIPHTGPGQLSPAEGLAGPLFLPHNRPAPRRPGPAVGYDRLAAAVKSVAPHLLLQSAGGQV